MYFPGSGVTVPLLLPPAAAFLVSFFTSMVGISGAFLLLPFQISVLGVTAPSISATNLVFNLVATPGGLWCFARERRVDWRLGLLVGTGTLPGLLAGWWLRSHWLSNARDFQLFVALVLAGLALRLFSKRAEAAAGPQPLASPARTRSSSGIFAAAILVGVVGGAYGVGGGAIMAPVLVAVFGLRVHAVAGATLLATLMTSIAGVRYVQLVANFVGLGHASGLAPRPFVRTRRSSGNIRRCASAKARQAASAGTRIGLRHSRTVSDLPPAVHDGRWPLNGLRS